MRTAFIWMVTAIPGLALAAAPDIPGYEGQTRKVLERAFERYRAIKTYQDTLHTEVEFDIEGELPGLSAPPAQSVQFCFARPNRAAIQAAEYGVYCDGQKLWEHIKPWGQYTESAAPPQIDLAKMALSKLGALESMEHPVAFLLTQPAPSLDAFGKIVRLTGIGAEKLKDRPGQRLRGIVQAPSMRGRQIELPMEIWFDDETGLVGEIGYDFKPLVEENIAQVPQKPNLRRFFRRSRVADLRVDQEIPTEKFAFKPETHDEKVAALKPPSPEQMQQKLVGRPAPGFSGKDFDGKEMSLSDLKGRIVVLDFWATWCGPCIMAMPALQKVADKYADKPVTVLGVNTDSPGQERRVADVLKSRSITFRQFMDPRGEAAQKYAVSGIPLKVLIDKQGVVQMFHVGYSPDEVQVLSEKIDALLAGKNLYE